jgi:hypothetical protein
LSSYLEGVIAGNLTRLSRLLRILRLHSHDLKLVPSVTVYMRWGKGPKQRLRFTKSGEPKIEEAYSRHFVWPGKGPFHPPVPRQLGEDGLIVCWRDGSEPGRREALACILAVCPHSEYASQHLHVDGFVIDAPWKKRTVASKLPRQVVPALLSVPAWGRKAFVTEILGRDLQS